MIVTTISTSGSKTSGGKHAVGKILKLRSDMFFLTMVEAQRRVIVLTEQDMCDQCEKESAGGRVPPEIDFVCAVIPDETQNTVGSGAIRKRRENTAFLVSDLTNQVSTSSPTICIAVNVGLGLDNLIVEITEARRCLSKSNEVVSRHASHQGERNVRDVISGSDGFSIQQLLQNTSRSSMHT
jgi:hypothetical protein